MTSDRAYPFEYDLRRGGYEWRVWRPDRIPHHFGHYKNEAAAWRSADRINERIKRVEVQPCRRITREGGDKINQLVFGSDEAKAIRDRDTILNGLVPCPTCYEDLWGDCSACKEAREIRGYHAVELLRRPGFPTVTERYLITLPPSMAKALQITLEGR